ncbi:hypothetical protein [Microbacterium sp.]|uniref:hypothetical protein n=1 Tax=Microbacterium sp. TaxID=51671 RepID=UPI0037357DED
MLIVLALVFGAVLGAGAHFGVPGRELRGAAIAPLLGSAVAAAAWMVLTWVGQGPDSAWVWIASIVLPAVIVPAALVLLTRTRTRADAHTRASLGI